MPTIAGYCTGKIGGSGLGTIATGVGVGVLATGVGVGALASCVGAGVGVGALASWVGAGVGVAELASGVGVAELVSVAFLQLVTPTTSSTSTPRIKGSFDECFLSVGITNLLGDLHQLIDNKG
jgi:hypothetical protein